MWLSIFGRVVLLLPLTGPASVYDGAGDFTKWTQTAAVLEIAHSAFGELVGSSPRAFSFFSLRTRSNLSSSSDRMLISLCFGAQ